MINALANGHRDIYASFNLEAAVISPSNAQKYSRCDEYAENFISACQKLSKVNRMIRHESQFKQIQFIKISPDLNESQNFDAHIQSAQKDDHRLAFESIFCRNWLKLPGSLSNIDWFLVHCPKLR